MDSSSNSSVKSWQTADRVGAVASFLCAIHCAALPFALSLLPLLGLEFLAQPVFEMAFVTFAALLALVSLVGGYRRHGRCVSLFLALPGIALLLLGIGIGETAWPLLHASMVTCGGMLVATAHVLNLRNDKRHGHEHDSKCVH